MRFPDILDIALISILLYFTLVWLKQQASRSFAVAIGIALVLYALARQTDMYLTSQIFKAGFTAVLVALVLIFHTDIRRIFERLATWKVFTSKHGVVASNHTIDILTESIAKCAEDHVGALVVITGLEPLERHIRGGVRLRGVISAPLIHGIFNTHSPTHDGAVIVEGETIDRFGVYLPLSQNVTEGGRAGTRHAAALGLSERCDALVIVASEERGSIAVAERGKLDRLESAVALKNRLQDFYRRIHPSKTGRRPFAFVTRNIGIKAAALCLAVGLWWVFSYRVTTIHRTYAVPVECRNLPKDFLIDDPGAAEARVSLSGPQRVFDFDPMSMAIAVDLSGIRDGAQDVPITDQSLVNKPAGLTVTQITPKTVRLKAYHLVEVDLPVKVPLLGAIPKGLGALRISTDPATVRVLVPRSRRAEYAEIKTEALAVADIKLGGTVRLALTIPDHAQLADPRQTTAAVTIEASEKR